jgi:bifunctional enzyme CysN/CysC
VMLTLKDEIDCSRGDVIAWAGAVPDLANRLNSTLVWMADEALVPHRSYWLKIGAQTVSARIDLVRSILDVTGLDERAGTRLGLNDIGRVVIDLDRPVPALSYAENRKLGAFILIDKLSNATVAAGMIDGFTPQPNLSSHEQQNNIRWIMGPRRCAWAARAAERLRNEGRRVAVLDHSAIAELGAPNLLRAATQAARLLAANGVFVLVTLGSAPEGALPGERIDSETDPDGAEEWVI